MTALRSPGRRRGARATRALAGLAAALAGALALAGCGIPLQSTAQSASVPREVLTSPSTTFPTTAANQTSLDVYFTSTEGLLIPTLRAVSIHQALAGAIRELLLGPTVAEQVTGVSTALGYATIKLFSLRRAGGVVTASFSAGFGQLSGRQEVIAVAQVVYTVASVYPDDGVVFELDGAVIAVPVEDGALASGPVHTSQYAALLAPKTATPAGA